jgi:hypothetical protein
MGIFLVSGLAILATSVYVGVQKLLQYMKCTSTDMVLLEVDHSPKIQCLYGVQPFEIYNDEINVFPSENVLLFKHESDVDDT